MHFKVDKHFRNRAFRFFMGLLLLIALSLLGDWLSHFIPFPIPGSVIGLILMLVLLVLGWVPLSWVNDAAQFLLTFMGLFYVPYGVGIIDVEPDILEVGWKIVLLTVITTIVVLWFTGKLFTYLKLKPSNE